MQKTGILPNKTELGHLVARLLLPHSIEPINYRYLLCEYMRTILLSLFRHLHHEDTGTTGYRTQSKCSDDFHRLGKIEVFLQESQLPSSKANS